MLLKLLNNFRYYTFKWRWLPIATTAIFPKNAVNVNINSINADKSTQSKVNKIKLKIIKTDQKSPSFYIKYPFLYSFGINLIILPICSGEAGINASM